MSEFDDFNRNFRKQTATVWEVNGVDSAGDPQFSSASPRSIIVRWEDIVNLIIGGDGEEEKSSAFILVSEDFKVGDYLFLGNSIASDPTILEGAFSIKKFESVPSPDAKKFNRKAFL